ncbi:IclR family transcriptional regulator [Azorhizobium oxalatiphilum]|uniref:IclR family transcriptional regulator n=1 Tax=Azorhizobium oxalatiphilum TaxID=980631 RepID=A0A917F8K5_9HYPH|nr:IclR family transcriptional regulator [Azorhizobium oxalatiphilum]GGF60119.1 IclR family transcriptional regulator [Azorhizobium oxalatiphilum]
MTPPAGSQAVMRALDVIEAASEEPIDLNHLSAAVGLTRSTTHRLASGLAARGYLRFAPGEGYSLGPKMLELGARARTQRPLTRIARPHLDLLAAETEDTVHLGVLEGDWALYLDKIPGRRRFEISSRVGERHPVWSTGLGKALILGADQDLWERFFEIGAAANPKSADLREIWLGRMRNYAEWGYAFDLEENEPRVRCVAAPIRDAAGQTVGAISLSSASHYMDDARMKALSVTVTGTADRISGELGWRPGAGRR